MKRSSSGAGMTRRLSRRKAAGHRPAHWRENGGEETAGCMTWWRECSIRRSTSEEATGGAGEESFTNQAKHAIISRSSLRHTEKRFLCMAGTAILKKEKYI